ncbi:hypothetical protein BaRGS_00039787 [Batillaria attramentaria]|uniref:Uncharacterized protein n=1 Tax=Batillaria attramentaria TaxID=370345 RepID=A0ABD0J1X4_9CAEN
MSRHENGTPPEPLHRYSHYLCTVECRLVGPYLPDLASIEEASCCYSFDTLEHKPSWPVTNIAYSGGAADYRPPRWKDEEIRDASALNNLTGCYDLYSRSRSKRDTKTTYEKGRAGGFSKRAMAEIPAGPRDEMEDVF